MNIMVTNTLRKTAVNFGEKTKSPSQNANQVTKIPLTETEEHFYASLKDLYTLDSNIATQKQNLRYYYSTQDKFEYNELLKERRKLAAKIKREAKNAGTTCAILEQNIGVKKEYNRYAPKVLRAKTLEDLKPILELINSYKLYGKTRELLLNLIKSMNIIK